MRIVAALLLLVAPFLALRAQPARVAIAPISRGYLDGQEALGESLTPLLLAALSDDPRWTLVERADLGSLEAEWSLGGAGAEQTALAVARGRLLGADRTLLLHPDLSSPENPAIRIEIIDTLRAEPLDVRSVALRQRPRARWFRNPPEADLAAVATACRAGLADSLAVGAARAQSRVAALVFLQPEPGAPTVSALAADVETRVARLAGASSATGRGGWRLLESTSPGVTHGEALLRATGFVGEQAPAPPPIDAILWGWYRSTGPDEFALRFRVWAAPGDAGERLVSGDADALADALFSTLPSAHAPAPSTDSATVDSDRRALARTLVAEARALAPRATYGSADADGCHRLLALAALLAPTDREIQELRLISARHALAAGPDASAARARIGLEYARLADHHWRGADGRLDLRLLAASFLKTEYTLPGQRERALRVAPLLARAPAAALEPHVALFEQWPVYCRAPDAGSFALLEVALPVIARYRPERLNTQLNGSVGVVPHLLETYHDENRARLLALVDRLPRTPSAPDPMADSPDGLPVADSPAPELPFPRERPGR